MAKGEKIYTVRIKSLESYLSETIFLIFDHEIKMINFRFGSQPDNQPWPGKVSSWVCATIPQAGTVTFDCVPEVSLHTGCCSVTDCGFVVSCMEVTVLL